MHFIYLLKIVIDKEIRWLFQMVINGIRREGQSTLARYALWASLGIIAYSTLAFQTGVVTSGIFMNPSKKKWAVLALGGAEIANICYGLLRRAHAITENPDNGHAILSEFNVYEILPDGSLSTGYPLPHRI